MHEAYNPDNTNATWTYCPCCERLVRCGHLGYVGAFAFYRHYVNPYDPVQYRERCLNSGWPVDRAFFVREDGRVVNRREWEAGWAPGDPEPEPAQEAS